MKVSEPKPVSGLPTYETPKYRIVRPCASQTFTTTISAVSERAVSRKPGAASSKKKP